ncbi:MAG TPA: hypothetical protein PK537_02925 [Candidatus Limiplasma sp.]|nr:hypothetical protein [Candidatus Limiplasma sp.]
MQTQVILEKQDLTYLSWTKTRNSSGTAGSFLKSCFDLSGEKIFYKLSNYDAYCGITGHECANELIVDRLLTLLGVEHLHYQLIHAEILINSQRIETYLCASSDFKRTGETKLALDAYYQAEKAEGESPLDFCFRSGWASYLWQLLAVDFLILNRDRHGANLEVLRNARKKTLRLAPLFDHGLSLLCRCEDDAAVRAFDVMADRKVQSFVGSQSAQANLQLIPHDQLPAFRPLREADKMALLAGLEAVLSQPLRDKIWDMLWKRWRFYEDFRHQG